MNAKPSHLYPNVVTNHPLDMAAIRSALRHASAMSEADVLTKMSSAFGMTDSERKEAVHQAIDIVTTVRNDERPGLMEVFLTEYGLSTDEGVALMCLAEALLRVPDAETIDRLIEDKLISSSWKEHVGESPSALVNTATYGLIVTSKVLSQPSQESLIKLLRKSIKRLGVPVIRTAVKRAMKEMGHQFVLGETIESALNKGAKAVSKGYTYSFDMLGEAALTQQDARKYFVAYQNAINELAKKAQSDDTTKNPGISIKLSALHPRYELLQKDRVLAELVPLVLELSLLAKEANLGMNIDAEEADRLDISLDVIEAVLQREELAGWKGFGVVVQAYNKAAGDVIDWLHAIAVKHNRKIMVRLVKGAYWDSEIKRAQVDGLENYPVFTQKTSTDISYLCCAKKLFSMQNVIYPQFATHNAHTVAAILQLAGESSNYEFQRLHGMGDNVYRSLIEKGVARCRIYAPVGQHRDLLAYLVRRLLENGANSSFVNQVVDLDVPVEDVVIDPFNFLESKASAIPAASDLFLPERINSRGLDLNDVLENQDYSAKQNEFATHTWRATPLLSKPYDGADKVVIFNPSNTDDIVGDVVQASDKDIKIALDTATSWANDSTADSRQAVLNKVADLLEANQGEISSLLSREAGKTAKDIIAEIREAVDFLRFYGAQANAQSLNNPQGVFVCISPWNFPLAIFIGQISAALAAGNGVIAKPAETTPLIAFYAIKLFHSAGVPRQVLQLLPGDGATVGASLVSSPKVAGVCFTGSTQTGIRINKSMADNMSPAAPLIAETGGLNAMIVDSTALPEQAIQDIINSAFQSAGQRCSALRLLYIQDDVYDSFLEMLFGAMDQLSVNNARQLSTDVGPLISATAQEQIQSYIDEAACEGRLLKTLNISPSNKGHFVAPTAIKVSGIKDMQKEIFGPVLHVAKFSAKELMSLVDDINNSGYGLTFGLHSRIDTRAQLLTDTLNVGNIYINRDQIGAVVGSQPFGGENLSGTGPKAGGPHYLSRFIKYKEFENTSSVNTDSKPVSLEEVQGLIDSIEVPRTLLSKTPMPGPTGELNELYEYGRGVVLCLGPDAKSAKEQEKIALEKGCIPIIVCPGASGKYAIDGFLPRELLIGLTGINLVAFFAFNNDTTRIRQALARREGAIIRLVCDASLAQACVNERHVCKDTTAAGGNASLLAMGT